MGHPVAVVSPLEPVAASGGAAEGQLSGHAVKLGVVVSVTLTLSLGK